MNTFERIRRLAYELPPPNPLTCDLVMEANTAESYCYELKAKVERYGKALNQIANQDYRGNRSPESEIAYSALNPE